MWTQWGKQHCPIKRRRMNAFTKLPCFSYTIHFSLFHLTIWSHVQILQKRIQYSCIFINPISPEMLQNYTSSMILLYNTLHISNIKLDLNCRKTFTEHIQPPYFAEPSQAEEMATCSKWSWSWSFFFKDKWRHQRLATASTMFICLIPTVRTEKKNHFASTEEFSRIPSFASNDFFNFELQQDDTHFK